MLCMWRSKNGLEKKLRETVCPTLLDIDGGSCHHIHNGCKVFTEVFGKHLKHLFQSICSDFKWSEDHRNILKDIYFQLGLTYRRPEMYFPTCWLKIHDTVIQTDYIFAFSSVLFWVKVTKLFIKIELEILKRDARFQWKELILSNKVCSHWKRNVSPKPGRKGKK